MVFRAGVVTMMVTLLLIAGCGGSSELRPAWMASTCGQPPLVQHPVVFPFSCDGNVVFRGARWSDRGRSTATATVTANIVGDCVPDCALAPVYRYRARVVASQVAFCKSRRVCGLLTAHLDHRDVRGVKVLRSRLVACI
jgi:hypothetical protein